MIGAPEVQAADVKRQAGTESVAAGRRAEVCGCPSETRNFGSKTNIYVVAVGFLQIVEHVLPGSVSVRVLHAGVDSREKSEIVKPSLRLAYRNERERISGLYRNAILDHVKPGTVHT